LNETATSRLPAEKLAYAAIRERILSGNLLPGARIVAEDVAVELNISRTPVREAFRQLDAEGLLVIRPNRGAVVASVSPDELLELFEMRAVLEGLAARRACLRWTEDFGDQLHLALRRLGRTEPTDPAFIPRHDEFHALICAHAGGHRLATETDRLRAGVKRHLALFFTQHETRLGTLEDHRILIEALESGDPDRAETAMREHITQTATRLVEEFRASSGYETAETGVL
jgi:DNA-binding GntR family transcriptional regulator